MEQEALEDFATQIQSTFLAGDIASMRPLLRFPLVIYSVAGVTVVRTEEELQQIIAHYQDRLTAACVAAGETRIVEQTEEENGRRTILVRNATYDSDGGFVLGSSIRYFLVRAENGYAAEMMEYVEAPFPNSEIENIYQ